MVFDEFIIMRNEKELTDIILKFQECYNTFLRCNPEHWLPVYFMGNPYSYFNSFFAWLNVDLSLLKPGAFIVGPNYVIECYQIKPELKKFILEHNPLYVFDSSYKRYGASGINIEDENIDVVPKQPDGYKLR